ncbi:ABC transporter ATP-binding protein [Methanolapillus millepedarum]|uniref:Multidrug export ATP-binding/permease protein n=1 Tax=Methanolapillus millepedarum TaxID=3028296 RepID=A0AA96ZW66_9EURY|nr:Putative multidrug export ATP-binding/permease protein [Methanosarcinaceae archaeon Ac7]
MPYIQERLGLSDQGYKDLKKAVFACVIANLTLLLPFVVIIQVITTLIIPLVTGRDLDTNRLWMLLAGGIFSAILYALAYKYEYQKTFTVAYAESENIRLDVAEHIRRLPLSFFNKKDLSELTTNMMADCASIEHVMSHVVPDMIATVITVVIACIMLSFYDWRMSLAMFCILPISIGIVALSLGIQKKYGERHVKAKLNVSGQVQEYLDGIKVVKAFGLAGEKSIALEKSLRTMMKEAIIFEGAVGVFIVLAIMVLQVGIGLVVWVGVNLITAGSLDAMTFLTFVMISAKIYTPLVVILTLWPELLYMMVSTKRMQTLRKEPLMDGDENTVLTNYDIQFKDVTFAYNEEAVFKNINLEIPENGVTALVGPSGSGKSTISRLIARFWDVNGGAIYVGGKNIREIDPERLMNYMSFVFQDVVLFNDTVMNNIKIGRQGATDDEVVAAAKAARCEEFIRAMPDGYNTVIGENGNTLSGGERQRISIARALLKDAPIVLLDEATASLDPENEMQIQEAISALIQNKTVIVIAHRLRTVLDADKIIVLDNGRILEEGTGEKLLAENGLFSKLYRIQQESLGWSAGNH